MVRQPGLIRRLTPRNDELFPQRALERIFVAFFMSVVARPSLEPSSPSEARVRAAYAASSVGRVGPFRQASSRPALFAR
jgi:hypothetical protein